MGRVKMNVNHIAVTILSVLLLSACSQKLVYNDNFPHAGPMFVPEKEPAPIPEPEPEPEPEPSVNELNLRAIANFTEAGLEAELTDRGVNVYLPPEIYFEGGNSKINLDARTKIAKIANEVNQDYLKNRLIEVSGHTDATGDPKRNWNLSKQRATAATGELVFSKVDITRLKTLWKGDTSPRYPEVREDGSVNLENRAKNRRVEFTILNPNEN